ncbi:MAG: alpha/beta hydrolase [bacterium]|nr:alpha/beta hydrolase [bacterium]
MKRLGVWRLSVGVVFLISFSLGFAQAQTDEVPRFERDSSCNVPTPADVRVTCGNLVVPIDRDQPERGTLRLAVSILHSTSDNPAPDPIVSLTGGPGGHTVEALPYTFRVNYRAFLETRDFIMFDQRGVGLSQPALNCPELTERYYEDARRERTVEEVAQDEVAALLDCNASLTGAGVNFADYTTSANAADVADLRRVLGYEEWNLFGVSYGTKLALTILRDHSEGVRSAILDSLYPLQANLYLERAANQQRAFDLLFAACEADAQCDEAYPDLEKRFYDLVERWNENPVDVGLREGRYYVNGGMLVNTVFGMLYVKSQIPEIPAFIARVENGDRNDLAYLAQGALERWEGVSEGMYYAIQCGEEVRFADINEALDSQALLMSPLRQEFTFITQSTFDICSGWNAREAQATEDLPVRSSIPALVLSGEFDPITPPSWGQLVADDLENSFFYVFPSVGHGAIRTDECAQSIALQFVEAPTVEPDSDCLADAEPPNFTIN